MADLPGTSRKKGKIATKNFSARSSPCTPITLKDVNMKAELMRLQRTINDLQKRNVELRSQLLEERLAREKLADELQDYLNKEKSNKKGNFLTKTHFSTELLNKYSTDKSSFSSSQVKKGKYVVRSTVSAESLSKNSFEADCSHFFDKKSIIASNELITIHENDSSLVGDIHTALSDSNQSLSSFNRSCQKGNAAGDCLTKTEKLRGSTLTTNSPISLRGKKKKGRSILLSLQNKLTAIGNGHNVTNKYSKNDKFNVCDNNVTTSDRSTSRGKQNKSIIPSKVYKPLTLACNVLKKNCVSYNYMNGLSTTSPQSINNNPDTKRKNAYDSLTKKSAQPSSLACSILNKIQKRNNFDIGKKVKYLLIGDSYSDSLFMGAMTIKCKRLICPDSTPKTIQSKLKTFKKEKPTHVVLVVGTDAWKNNSDTEWILRRDICNLVKAAKRFFSNAKILVSGIIRPHNIRNSEITAANKALAILMKHLGVEFIDPNPWLKKFHFFAENNGLSEYGADVISRLFFNRMK